MDIRDVIRKSPEMVVGHKPVTEWLNVRDEMRRFSKDPLQKYLTAVSGNEAALLHDDLGRYTQAFSWYALCLRRVLDHSSIARRSDKELQWHPVTVKHSPRQAQIARRRSSTEPYLELDYQNLIIHTCILLDRAITLSQRFLRGRNLPSFTSFREHKKFLKAHSGELQPALRDYADGVMHTTGWFDIPLKVLRDKYLMHSSERHICSFGWSTESQWDLLMMTIVSGCPGQRKPLQQVKLICFSPRRLARDVEAFLSWFSDYAQTTLDDTHSI